MTPKAVAILEPGYSDYGVERSLLEPLGAQVVPVAEDRDAVSALSQICPEAVMVRERSVSEAEMRSCPDLRVIVRYGVGVDNVDLEEATRREVYVANVPDYGAEHEVSDQALALYLAVQRRIVTRDQDVRSGSWNVWQREIIPSREGAVLGLIGYGRIGARTHLKFQAFGFERTLVVDPALDPERAQARGVELTDIDRLCREADVVSLHTPLSPATRHILNAERIASMKPGAIVINVSRGGLIDEQALAAALKAGRLFGAGLDVFEREPPVAGDPMLDAPNAVLTDHMGWYSERSIRVLKEAAAGEVARVLRGEVPINWVNRWS